MPEEKDTRKWYQKKTNKGLIIMGLGAVFQLIPFTAPIAPTITSIGMIMAGYGVRDAVAKIKK